MCIVRRFVHRACIVDYGAAAHGSAAMSPPVGIVPLVTRAAASRLHPGPALEHEQAKTGKQHGHRTGHHATLPVYGHSNARSPSMVNRSSMGVICVSSCALVPEAGHPEQVG